MYLLKQVSYPLLIFFCGMFVTIEGFDKTRIPSSLWDLMEPYVRINRVSGIAVLALDILVLSNLVLNLPTGMLMSLFSSSCLHFLYCSFICQVAF